MDDIRADLARIAAALERLAPPAPSSLALEDGWAFRWLSGRIEPVDPKGLVPLDLVLEVEPQKARLTANTRQFAQGRPANNALLWGARGTGKSALVKAVAAAEAARTPSLKLLEFAPDRLDDLARVLTLLASTPWRVIVFIDDLSFAGPDATTRALKPALEGGLQGRTANIVVYATSNRRQIVARQASSGDGDVFAADAAEDELALSDRFGLVLGFHPLDQVQYLRLVQAYAARLSLPLPWADIERRALTWSRLRAARSGRTAWQFIIDLAAELGVDATL